jgi:hypothetical protein
LSTLGDGRLDEIAARRGLTITQVRRMVGPQQMDRPSAAAVNIDEVVDPSQAGGLPMTAEDPSALDADRLEELAASLGVTVGDVVRMIEVAGPRGDGRYPGRLDVD